MDEAPPPLRAPRREYAGPGLDAAGFAGDPMTQFGDWFAAALGAGVPEPDAMTLATCDAAGGPAARLVLLKSWGPAGFVFATNYGSAKGRDLADNPRAALVFRWAAVERQVRATGTVRRTPRAESDAIFAARPRGAQLAAWASPQSDVVVDRAELDRRYADTAARFADVPVPRPAWWGGYRLRPEAVEFWQGRPDRMHDRLRYRRAGRRWVLERLAP